MSEADRIDLLCDWLIEEVEELREAYHTRGFDAWASVDAQGLEKPEGVGSELADIYLIAADIWNQAELDPQADVRAKLDYNHVRQYRRDANGVLLTNTQPTEGA